MFFIYDLKDEEVEKMGFANIRHAQFIATV